MRAHGTIRVGWAVLSILVLDGPLVAASDVQYSTVTYTSARLVIDADFDTVVRRLKDALAPVDLARAYERMQSGATHAQMVAGSRRSNPDKKYYQVYEIPWSLPIFVDSGERKRVHRFGIGGGPGRPLVGKYPAAGLHLVTDINVFSDGARTIVDAILPSGKYRAGFPDLPDLDRLAEQADRKMLAFLNGLRTANAIAATIE